MRRFAVLAAILTAPVALAQTAPHLAGLSGASYTLSKSGSTYVLKSGANGAVSSGSNPGALLQTAVTALASSGGRILVQDGTYIPTTSVSLSSTSGVTIECSRGAIFQRTAANDDLALFSGTTATRATIRGCTFDSNDIAVPVGYEEINFVGGTDIEISGNRWINMDNARPGYAISVTLGTGNTGLTVAGNTIKSDTPTAENKSAVNIVGWSKVSVTDNRVEGYGGVSYQVGSGTSANTYDIDISRNVFVQVHAGRVMVRSSSTSGYGIDGVLIAGNRSYFTGSASSDTLKKGLVNVGESVGSTYHPMTRNVVIADNVSVGDLGIAINVGDASYGGVENVTVTGNVIDGAGYSSHALDSSSISLGINLKGNLYSRGIVVKGNTIQNVAQYGILAAAKEDVTIAGNVFYKTNQLIVSGESSSTSPIFINYGLNVKVTDNQIRRCFTPTHASTYTTAGITVNSSDNVLDRIFVERNFILDDRDDGVSDLDGDGTVGAEARGTEYGIRFGDSGASDYPKIGAIRDNVIQYTRTGDIISSSASTAVSRLVSGNIYNGTPVTAFGVARSGSVVKNCIGFDDTDDNMFNDRNCDGDMDSGEYPFGIGKAVSIDTDMDGTGNPQVSVNSTNVQFNPNADASQDWIINATVIERQGDTTDAGGYLRGRGFFGIQADSDNDATGVEQIQFDPNGDDSYDWIIDGSGSLIYEGTADASETTITVTDPTADRTITLPDATGTVALVAGSSTELQYRNGTTLGAAPIILDSDGTKQDRLVSTADLVGPHGQPVGGDTGGSYFFPGQYRATSLARAATSRTTMASTASVSVPIAFIGDSITAYLSTAIPAQWQRRGALGGMGYEPANDSDVYSYTPATTMRTKTYAGTWTLRHPGSVAPSSAVEWGINGSSATADSDDDTLTYTVNVPCNRITAFYAVQSGGGSFEWSTNGSSWTEVSTAGTDALGYVTSGGDSIGIYYGATAEVGNTLYLRYKSGSTGPVTIYGLYSYTRYINQQPDRDNVVPLWLAAGGITLGSRTWAAGVDEDGTGSVCTSAGGATLTTGWATRGVGNIYLDALLDLLLPAEIVVALGANDGCVGGTASCCTAGSTPAEYASDLSTLLDGLAAYFPATYRPDVILVPPWQRGQATGGSTTYFEKYNATRQPGYRKAAYTQARARGYSVADLPSFWGGFTAATAAGLMVDSVHQTQAGRQVLATWYSEFLLDRGWPNAQRSVDPYCGVKTLASGVLSAPACNYVQVASSGALTSITTCAREDKGRRLTLECTSTATWTIATGQSAATAPIVNSAWTCGAGKSISFTCDGTNWREIARAGEANTAAQTACQSFGAINAAANTTVYLGTSQASTQDMIYLPVPADATLKGIACVNVGALSGGTATITVCKNGGATCSDVTLSYSSADASLAGKSDTTCTTNCTYAAGDKIVVKSVNDASYAPTTVDWTCNVCYTMVAW